MALANLNINVNTNLNNSINAMTEFRTVANASMFKSTEAVNNFQKNVQRDSESINAQVKAMSGALGASSVDISKSAQVSADSISGITKSVDASIAGVEKLSKGMTAAGEDIKKAIGPEAAAQVDNLTTKTEEFIGTRLAIAAVGLALGTVAAAAAATGYAAYKASGFLAGLITGESYKSKNIDALIATNKEVESLRESLILSVADANALNDSLQKLGINKADISDVFSKVQNKVRGGDTSELDRLGVTYKNANGQILETSTIVDNAKRKLDEYSEGWDRNQAAVAMGLGSYAQISNYLKVNQAEVQASKDRLAEYNLGLGPESQKAVAEYQAAMLLFNNETRLMGDGFKRVWADQVMPIYTTWAEYFTDGWPSIVDGTRHIVAAFTSLGYGLKMVFDIAYNTAEGLILVVTGSFASIAAATEAALSGNFSGAKAALIAGWEDVQSNVAGIGTKITEDAKKNLFAMQLAQGQFSKDTSSAGGPGSGGKKGKGWKPAPDATEEEAATPGKDYTSLWASVGNKYLEYIKSFNGTKAELVKSAAAFEIQINQQAYDWGLIDLKTYLDKKHDLTESAIQDEIDLKKLEVEMYDNKVQANTKGALTDKDPKAAAAYVDALKKRQDATTELIRLEAKWAEVSSKNIDEDKKGNYDQAAGLSRLNIQLLEVTGRYEDAARARATFEQQSPEYKQLSPAEQAIRDEMNRIAIYNAGALQKQESADVRFGTQDIKNNTFSPFGQADNYAMLDTQYNKDSYAVDARLEELDAMGELNDEQVNQYNDMIDRQFAIDEKYAADKAALDKDMAMKGLQSLGDSLTSMGETLMKGNKEQFEAGKKMAIAGAVISMTLGAIQAYTSMTSIPYVGPALGAIAAAAVVAAGMSNIARIESTQYEGRELGGPVRAGQSYIVGEKRPELFTPGASGMITPYVPGGGGTTSVTQVLQISTGVADTVRAEIGRMLPLLRAQAVSAVQQATRQGLMQAA